MYCSNWRQNSIHGTLYQLICSCFIAIIKFFTGTLVTKHIIASLHVSVHHMGLVFNLLLGLLHCHRLLTVICFLRFNAYLFTYFVSLKQTTNSFTETKVRKFSNHKIQILETHEDSPYYYGGCINSGSVQATVSCLPVMNYVTTKNYTWLIFGQSVVVS